VKREGGRTRSESTEAAASPVAGPSNLPSPLPRSTNSNPNTPVPSTTPPTKTWKRLSPPEIVREIETQLSGPFPPDLTLPPSSTSRSSSSSTARRSFQPRASTSKITLDPAPPPAKRLRNVSSGPWKSFLAALDPMGRIPSLADAFAEAAGIDVGAAVSWPAEAIKDFVEEAAKEAPLGIRIHARVLMQTNAQAVWESIQTSVHRREDEEDEDQKVYG
jgi:hypothetical protein